MSDTPNPGDVTMMLEAVERGDQQAAADLLPVVYDELRRLANHLMQGERSGQTIQPTALVHEAYMKLVGGDAEPSWENRRHFFNASALAMRRVLVDRARSRNRVKRGGDAQRADIDPDILDIPVLKVFDEEEIETVDAALDALAEHNKRWAEIVQLRMFVGLSVVQTAEALGISPATVKSDWSFARAWIAVEVKKRLEAEG